MLDFGLWMLDVSSSTLLVAGEVQHLSPLPVAGEGQYVSPLPWRERGRG